MEASRDVSRSSKDDLLARVRESLGRASGSPHAAPSPPAIDEALVRLCGPSEDLVARLAQRAQSVGMSVRLTTPDLLTQVVREVVAVQGVPEPVVAISIVDPADRLACERAVGESKKLSGGGSGGGAKTRLDALYDADIGITDVEAAIAESGTLVVRADSQRWRGTFLVPPVHVAIVRATQIVPDLLDLWELLATRGTATSRVFITGPSKTADIEGILITGVHGPREVRIVLVDDR